MNESISDFLLNRFNEFIASSIGVHFSKERWNYLEAVLAECSKELGFENTKECIELLPLAKLTKSQIEILARHLTIGETYFFRDRASFEVLERHILPELINKRRATDRRLRIWSAGCCTGEEPYSIAMLLTRLIPDFKKWNISILATDINPHFLHKAASGVYKEWSFRETPSDIRKTFFQEVKKNSFELSPYIRSLVTFEHLNLVEDSYPNIYNYTNAMDIIFCRNVTMYFQPEQTEKVIGGLAASLVNDGWLFLSAVEAITNKHPQLDTMYFPKAILYRKSKEPLISTISPYSYFSPNLFISDDSEEKIDETSYLDIEAERYNNTPLSDDVDEDKIDVMDIARKFANQGALEQAMEWSEKLIKLDRLNPSAWYLYATICEEQGQFDQAIDAFKKTLFLDQDYVLAHLSIGNCARRLGELEESERYFKAALSSLEKYPNEHLLPETKGMTAGSLKQIIQATINSANGNYESKEI